MAPTTLFFIFLAVCRLGTGSVGELCRGTQCFSGQEWSRRCVGAHCQRRADPAVALRPPQAQAQQHRVSTAGKVSPSYQRDAHSYGHHQPQSAPLAPYIIHAQPSATDGSRRTNPRTITAEVFHPDCAGGTCPTTVSHRQSSDDCRGIGCKLPPRTPPKPGSCVGDGCAGLGGDAARGRSSGPVHVTERAAQSLDEFPDFGSERGAFIQLACDMKPGTNEVPSEDALVLQLQLSKSQETLVEALRSQQVEVKELQRLLGEQHGTLVNQQREILDQQRRMFEQMEQVSPPR
ncbi:uncharacterized protein LOC107990156 [Cynoglossus semilaevis]|uniref:uncharacterized protein LOC107990156 n=1 Tax=Cynoglossus semilaevis TaxID=244447 RepID=UPI0007DCB7CC|nr:uncharacterized protein LOC107990156 [Cynoglossus semilaevis]